MNTINKAVRLLRRRLNRSIRRMLRTRKLVIHGVQVDLAGLEISQGMLDAFYDQTYEADEVRLLRRYLTDDDVVMEIGAGIGLVSTLCAKRVGSERVFAYEANPAMIERIHTTYAGNQVNPPVLNAVLGAEKGEATFFVERDFWSSSLMKRTDHGQQVMVPMRSFADELEAVRPTFLVVDIEGGEATLFDDTRLSSVQRVLIEIHPELIGDSKSSDVVKQLLDQGFILKFSSLGGSVLFFYRPLRGLADHA